LDADLRDKFSTAFRFCNLVKFFSLFPTGQARKGFYTWPLFEKKLNAVWWPFQLARKAHELSCQKTKLKIVKNEFSRPGSENM